MPRSRFLPFLLVVMLLGCRVAIAQEDATPSNEFEHPSTWAEFVEPDFPFFSSVLDGRKLGGGFPTDNLTPRGLILNLGNDCWACFDVDLLRVSALWQGQGVTPVSMSQISYHSRGEKVQDGQNRLPQPNGTVWIANGIYPGWQTGSVISLSDPRPPTPDPREPGRGPLTVAQGRLKAIRLTQAGLCLEYEAHGAFVREWISSQMVDGSPQIHRSFELRNVKVPLCLALGTFSTNSTIRHTAILSVETDSNGKPNAELDKDAAGVQFVRMAASPMPVRFQVTFTSGSKVRTTHPAFGAPSAPAASRWKTAVTTKAHLSTEKKAYVTDYFDLPVSNPWKRNVRLADIAFFKDGRAAVVTFDGDVWMIRGLGRDNDQLTWTRFTSGLHEPLSLCVRDEELFVFDRNGIWRLRDTDGNGEADVHELFSNAFAQTAETREYSDNIRPAPDGSFIIAKGGIQSSTIGRDNGTVMRVSRDGLTSEVLAYGLREPFVGVHPKTGLITASDQQGNYIPSTPLHIIRDRQFYGFLSSLLPKEKYPAPIAEPLTWIPHPINASGAAQVWLTDARMGPLNDALIHIGYYRPELFLVLLNERAKRTQASVVSLARFTEFSPLGGAVNPVDGQLYFTGLQIWGTTAKKLSGLARLRHTGAPSTLPREITPMDKGILLRFDVPVDSAGATDPANYSIERWNYRRTSNYGSPHFKPDGAPGQEWMSPSSAYVSKDGRRVFVAIPGMAPVMQMRLGWSIGSRDGLRLDQNAFFTPYELVPFNPSAEGFDIANVDLTPRLTQKAETPVTVEEGRRVAELMGCVACHSADGSTLGKTGPTWKGLFGSERAFADGTKTMATADYIRESVLKPAAHIVRGFEKSDTSMPSYEGVITDSQIEALIRYIGSLK